MISSFDYYNQHKDPTIILCNPDKTQLYAMGEIYDRQLKLRFNALSEFSFTCPKQVNGHDIEYFDYLTYRRLVYIQDVGYFMITDSDNVNEGDLLNEKKITAKSIEVQLNLTKKLSLFKGTYKFYDLIDPSDTFLGTIIDRLPGWTVGTVSSSLLTLYRTFNESDTTIYNLLMTKAEDSYQCIFEFDIINQTISAVALAEATTTTDIFLSTENLIEKIEIKELTDELVTALNVYGGGDLSINTVNPLGTDTIYDFSYYETLDWMNQGLIDALDAWEAKVIANQPTYANLLTQYKNNSGSLVTAQAGLVTLQSEYTALEQVQSVRAAQKIPMSDPYTDPSGTAWASLTEAMTSKTNQINAKKLEVTNYTTIVAGLLTQLQAINTDLSFDTNFTSAQLIELDSYIIGSTYQNKNFVQTDIMTEEEIQTWAQALYDQGITVLARLAQPRYSFEIDSVNFLFLKEFQTFINQLELGCIITVEKSKGVFVYPALLGIDLNYDNPEEFKLIFGNRYRLDTNEFMLSDLLGQAVDQGVNGSFNSEIWNSWYDTYKNPVATFITSSLNAAVNNLISSNNEDVLINQNGIRCRTAVLDSSGSAITDSYGNISFDDTQLWLTHNTIAMTDDNWQTAKIAIGMVELPTSGSVFGIVGEMIAGTVIAGNQLTITNEREDGTPTNFVLDGSGARLYNASLTVSNTKNSILLDPTNGIKITAYEGGTWKNKFWADSSGNINFSGLLTGASGTFSGSLTAAYGTFTGTINAPTGTIGGWNISSAGLSNGSNYIKNDGTVQLGNGVFKIDLSGNSFFTGKIWAANLADMITASKIASVNAGTITSGTMSADRIYGGTINWDGGSIYVDGTHNTRIYGSGGVILKTDGLIGLSISSSTEKNIFNGHVSILSGYNFECRSYFYQYTDAHFYGTTHFEGGTHFNQRAYMNSDLSVGGVITINGHDGVDASLAVYDAYGDLRFLTFNKGILTGYS